jgi:hypothetical protein
LTDKGIERKMSLMRMKEETEDLRIDLNLSAPPQRQGGLPRLVLERVVVGQANKLLLRITLPSKMLLIILR